VPELEGPWLYRIAHNVCVSRALGSQRRARVERPADVEALDVAAPPVGRPDELLGLGDALAGMPDNLRRVLLLREWQGLSYAEIAETTEQTQGAVETLIFRARRHLAKALGAVNIGTPFWWARRWLLASAAPAKVAAGTAVVGLAGGGLVLGLADDPPRSPSVSRTPAPVVVSVDNIPIVARRPVAVVRHRTSARRTVVPARVAEPVVHADRAVAPAPVETSPTVAKQPLVPHESTPAPAAPVLTPVAVPGPAPAPAKTTTAATSAATKPQPQPDPAAITATVSVPLAEQVPVDAPVVEVTVPAVEVPVVPDVPELPAVPTVTVRVPKLPRIPKLP